MKKLLTGALLLALSIPSYADADVYSFCEAVMEAAEATMRGHLSGVSPVEAIELANQAPVEIQTQLREMIVRAYSSPRYSTDEYKISAINEFAADYYIDCIKGLSK